MSSSTGRAAWLACVVLTPFLRFLVENGYSLLRVESLAAAGVLCGICLLVGWLCRGRGYLSVLALAAGAMCAYPLQTLIRPLQAWPLAAVVAGAAIVVFATVAAMREKFFPVLAVFSVSLLAVEFVVQYRPPPGVLARTGSAVAGSVLWLILDEQIGLDGFPAGEECVAAKGRFQRVLDKYNFTSYPGAYSNYASTFDSVPSILNARLMRSRQELMDRQGAGHLRHYAIRENALFAQFRARGFSVVGYQPSAVQTCRADLGPAECRQYRENLGWLQEAPGGWNERFRWIVGSYQASDPVLVRLNGFFPFRFGLKMTGPLAVANLWPSGLAQAIGSDSRRTLFFAHLLTPHLPYLYRKDGRIRPISEWAGDRADERLTQAAYDRRYRRYCEQSEFIAGQLDAFLAELDRSGVLRGMTVVVHGDHGSRIRRKLDGASAMSPAVGDSFLPDLYDYRGRPERRDLIDRFSALLAIKAAGAQAPSRAGARHSLLTQISRDVLHHEPQGGVAAADRVYLAAADGTMRSIDILDYWSDTP